MILSVFDKNIPKDASKQSKSPWETFGTVINVRLSCSKNSFLKTILVHYLSSVQRAVHQQKGQGASMLIMHRLARQKEAPVAQMMTKVKVSWSDFTEGLKYLEDAGLVEMDDGEDGGTLRLTDEGQHWAQTISLEMDNDEEQD